MIPAAWLVALLAVDRHTQAQEHTATAHAIAHGAALAMNGKDAKVARLTRRIAREAAPLILPDDDTPE